MYKLLGIEFAPLNIPLSRRLQTAAVLAYVFMFLQGLSTLSFTLFFMLLFFTPFFWVSLLYAAFYVYDFKTPQIGGRFNMNVRRWRIWKYLADYFPVELVKTADLDPNKNYIMGISPHSVMCFSAMSAFGTEALGFSDRFPGITPHLVTLNQQFFSPITRELNLALGILSANRDSLKYVLSNRGVCKNKGQVCIILIGGARESLESYPGRYPLIIKNRKGFVRIALETGANLVPVFVFGENDVYNTLEVEKGSKLRKFQEWVKSWSQFGLPIIRGRGIFNYTFGLIPYRKPTFVVVGKPIDVKKIEHPSQQQVDELHDLYVKSLIELFNEHKHKYCKNKDIQLEFL